MCSIIVVFDLESDAKGRRGVLFRTLPAGVSPFYTFERLGLTFQMASENAGCWLTAGVAW